VVEDRVQHESQTTSMQVAAELAQSFITSKSTVNTEVVRCGPTGMRNGDRKAANTAAWRLIIQAFRVLLKYAGSTRSRKSIDMVINHSTHDYRGLLRVAEDH